MEEHVRHGDRGFVMQAYPDAVHDAWAVELAELVDGELGPDVVMVLFPRDDVAGDVQVLLADGELPLPVLRTFMTRVAEEERRLRDS